MQAAVKQTARYFGPCHEADAYFSLIFWPMFSELRPLPKQPFAAHQHILQLATAVYKVTAFFAGQGFFDEGVGQPAAPLAVQGLQDFVEAIRGIQGVSAVTVIFFQTVSGEGRGDAHSLH